MAKLSILAGSTSQSVNVFIQNSSSTTGAGLTGIAPAGGSLLAGFTAYYSFSGANAASVSMNTLSVLATVGTAWTSNSIVEIDATNMPGVYRLDIPNAALAAAHGRSVTIMLKGGTNVTPTPLEIELTGFDNQSTTDGGLSKLTSLTFTVAGKVDSNVYTWNGTAVATPATAGIPETNTKNINNVSTSAVTTVKAVQGLTLADTIATYTGNTPQTGDNFPRIGVAGAGLTALGDTRIANLDATVSSRSTYAGGAVASVTGSVGSVVGLTASNLDVAVSTVPASVWSTAVAGTTTAIQAMRGFIAAMLGKASGLDVNAPKFRNIADTKDVISATTDASGNRITVTLDLT